MHIAALPDRLRQHLADCRLEAGMVVRDSELDAVEPALLERQEEVAPARTALAVGELDGEDLSSTLPIDADCDQHRLALDHPRLTDPLVAGVEHEIGKGFLQPPLGKRL